MTTGRWALIVMTLASLALLADAGRGQAQDVSNAPDFDAASIRDSDIEGRRTMTVLPSTLSFSNVTLSDALAAAYGIERYRVVGPDWLNRHRYVIIARTNGPTESGHMMVMLQRLLIARFNLVHSWEQRQFPAYVLRIGKNGPRGLTPTDERLVVIPALGGMTFQGMTMTEFVDQFLARLPSIDRPVIDATGLSGRYTFTLRVFDTDPPPGELKPAVLAGGPELFIHALENVGLTLARETRSLDALIVEHADKTPKEN